MSTLPNRVFSAVVFVGVMAGGVLWNGWSLAVLLLLILIKGLVEFYNLAEALGYQSFRVSGIAISVVFFLLAMLNLHWPETMAWLAWGLPVMVLSAFLSLFKKQGNTFLPELSLTFFGVLYLTLPLSLLLVLAFKGGIYQGWLVLFLLSLVWINDTMAYAVGKTLGSRSLAPVLSPGKTIEGTLGGLCCSILTGFLWYWTGWLSLTLVQATLGALLIGCGAVIGDLFQSALKRQVGWEDSGTIIPGHGGVLDRFDGMLISILVVFPLLYMW